MEIYGYARVSTKEQNPDRQMDALLGFPVSAKNIVVDKQSGKDFDRPGYLRLLKKLQAGDLLVIPSIDRLGRNYDEIMVQWRLLMSDKGVDIVVMDMPLLDTRSREDDLTGKLIADLVLQILSYVSETERRNIRKRQEEGIRAAGQRGVQFGRPKKEVPENFEQVVLRWRRKEIHEEQALIETGMSRARFYRTIRRMCPDGNPLGRTKEKKD